MYRTHASHAETTSRGLTLTGANRIALYSHSTFVDRVDSFAISYTCLRYVESRERPGEINIEAALNKWFFSKLNIEARKERDGIYDLKARPWAKLAF